MKDKAPSLLHIAASAFLAAALCACALVFVGCAGDQAASDPGVGDVETMRTQDDANASASEEAAPKEEVASSEKAAEAKAAAAAVKRAKKQVKKLVGGYEDSVAVAVATHDGAEGFQVNGSERFVSASMIKLLILAELASEVDSGKLSLSTEYQLASSDVVSGTGTLQTKSPGTVYTYEQLAEYMIASSDNTATNVIIDALGMDAINAKAEELGLSATKLNRKMMDSSSGVENYISANDAATILTGFANGSIASKKMCKKARKWLLAQEDTEGLAVGLPQGVDFAHKTGSLGDVRHDGGIVYAESGAYVVVVLTTIGAAEANSLMAEISGVLYENLG